MEDVQIYIETYEWGTGNWRSFMKLERTIEGWNKRSRRKLAQKLAGGKAMTRNIMRKLAITIPGEYKKKEQDWKREYEILLHPKSCRWKMYRESRTTRSTYFVKQCNLIRARKSSRIESSSFYANICVKLHSYLKLDTIKT